MEKLSQWKGKTRFLRSCSHFSTIVRLTNWTLTTRLEEKLDGNNTTMFCCFEKILKAATDKTGVIKPLASHLINQPRRTRHSVLCKWIRDELMSDVLSWASTHGHASVGWSVMSYIHQLCADTGCCLEDLPGAIDGRDGWREGIKWIPAICMT